MQAHQVLPSESSTGCGQLGFPGLGYSRLCTTSTGTRSPIAEPMDARLVLDIGTAYEAPSGSHITLAH